MEELRKDLDQILYDLQQARSEMTADIDSVENACCRIQSALYDLRNLRKALCDKADEMK